MLDKNKINYIKKDKVLINPVKYEKSNNIWPSKKMVESLIVGGEIQEQKRTL